MENWSLLVWSLHAHTTWAFSLQAPRDQETTGSGDENDLSLARTQGTDFLHSHGGW